MKLSLRFVCVALVIAALGFVLSTQVIPSHAATSPATIVTDLKKYSEGQTMLISGTGFTAGAAVYISVLRPDNLTDYQTAAKRCGRLAWPVCLRSSCNCRGSRD